MGELYCCFVTNYNVLGKGLMGLINGIEKVTGLKKKISFAFKINFNLNH